MCESGDSLELLSPLNRSLKRQLGKLYAKVSYHQTVTGCTLCGELAARLTVARLRKQVHSLFPCCTWPQYLCKEIDDWPATLGASQDLDTFRIPGVFCEGQRILVQVSSGA